MRLFYSPGACSLAPHIVAEELGLEYEAAPVDLKTKTLKTGEDYRAVNPKGSVPALQLSNKKVLTETGVILQYLADQKPEAGLIAPPGTWERYRCQEWLNYIATELHKGFSPLWHSATPDAYKDLIRARLHDKILYLSGFLKESPYLMGDYSVADAYLFTVLRWARHLKVEISDASSIHEFMNRMRERPAVMTALKSEGVR